MLGIPSANPQLSTPPVGCAIMSSPSLAVADPQKPTRPAAARLVWVDNLRTLMILLVVALHSAITYSHVGGWYFKQPPEPPIETKLIFLLGEAHLQAFFMGLLFFVAGYFAHLSLKKRGPKAFLQERLVRLGVPLLLYVAVIHPFIVYLLNPWNAKFPPLGMAYWDYLKSGRFLRETGPLWFAEALLIFCIGLVVFRSFAKSSEVETGASPLRFTGKTALTVAAGLSLASFLVRIAQPIGTNVQNLQLCFFPQYIVFFAGGVWVAQRGSLDELARSQVAKVAGWTALIGGPIGLIVFLLAMKPHIQPGVEPPMMGGMNPFALGYATWEQFTGVGLALGAMALVARVWSQRTAFSGWLSDRSFGVYVFHAAAVVGFTILLRGYSTNPYVNALALTIIATVVSYLFTDLVRRVPGVKAVI